MVSQTSLYVFRRDLRISDNTALAQALMNSEKVVTLFVLDAFLLDRWRHSSYRLSFMAGSLKRVMDRIEDLGGSLMIRIGDPVEIIADVAREIGAGQVYLNRDYALYARRRDRKVYERCGAEGIGVSFHSDQLLQEPEMVHKADGSPYQVFTPFYRAAARLKVREPGVSPESGFAASGNADESRRLLASIGEATEFPDHQAPKRFASLNNYNESRDFPAVLGTSRLSAFLKFGVVSPRQVYDWASQLEESEPFRRQLYWRDFYHHIGWHFPRVYRGCFRSEYDNLHWLYNSEQLSAWRNGCTGFPLVDAGMRELKSTGYMHNRVRMVVASFLTKNLQISWRTGEAHFARYLIDFDPASNNGNWQWAASTGCDSQPYFRIFNPWRQQKRFDPDCTYIKKWVEELRSLDARGIHGLEKDPSGYIKPIVDLKASASASISRFKSIKKN
mgnify:CR=1 FL=1